MKSWLKWLLLAIPVVLIALTFLGPRVNSNVEYKTVILPADPDGYLADAERQHPDLKPGTEKRIVWAKKGQKTQVSLIFLHGFSGSRKDFESVMDRLSTELGANLFYNRYAGHGSTPEAMGKPQLQDWVNDTAEAVAIGQQLGEKVVVVALSTGAPLVTWLATKTNTLGALVLVSPNFGLADSNSEFLLLPWGNLINKLVCGDYYQFKIENEAQVKYSTPRFRSEALLTLMSSVALGRKTELEKLTLPILVLYAANDKTISLPRMREAFARMGSKDKALEEVAGARGHVLAGDLYSPETTDKVVARVVEFIRNKIKQ